MTLQQKLDQLKERMAEAHACVLHDRLEDEPKPFDGHTSQDVVKRLEKIAQFGKTEKAPAGSTVCQHGGEPFTCKVCRAPEKEQLNE